MKVNKRTAYLFFLLVLCSGCGSTIDRKEFISWMENPAHNLRQVRKENGITYTLQYKTIEYISEKNNSSPLIMEEIKSEATNNLLFDLFITCPDGPLSYKVTSADEMNARYYYYHFKFIEQISLETAAGTIKPTYCIADKGTGLNNTLAFNISFKKTADTEDNFKFVIDDTQLGSGTVKFLFKTSYLKHIPSIKN